MATNDPFFSDGESVIVNSAGETVDTYFSYGASVAFHEWEAEDSETNNALFFGCAF